MLFKHDMALVVTVVDNGFSGKVIEASKAAGADGATVLQGRGVGIHDSGRILGVDIQPGKEIILIIVRKSARKNIMKEIVRACNLSTEGRGLTFCVPIEEVAGAMHLFNKKLDIRTPAQKVVITEEKIKEKEVKDEKDNK